MVGESLCEILGKKDFGIDVVAIADSRSATVESKGLDLKRVILQKKKTGFVGAGKSMDTRQVISDVDSDAVVELTPANPKTADPGLTHIRTAIATGHHVVTANKMPLALHFSELQAASRSRHVQLKYGACVGAGIPILEFGRSCAAVESVESIQGVLNATSNFILSEMENGGSNFQQALKQARGLGYAEADSRLDLNGIDAAAKIVILANHVLGTDFALDDVRPIQGISNLTTSRIKGAWKHGRRLRSLAICDKKLSVRLAEVPKDYSLCVYGAWSAVKFHCVDSGDRVVSGPAGGGLATSRAVLRDLVAVANS